MALNHFIPEIWSASILENFHKQSVVTALANRDYEGELTQGSKIHIPGIVDIAVKDYKAAGRTTTPDSLSDTGIDLLIDQEKSFDFFVDDIDHIQSKPGFDDYTASAANGLTEDAETFLNDLLVTKGTSIASPASIATYEAAYAAILKVRGALNLALAPKTDRYLIINSAFEAQLLSDSSKLTSFDKVGDSDGLREASIGRILGFNVVTSDFLAEETLPQAIGLYAPALAFVSQITKTEAMRGENKFADRIRGLHVYGGGVLRPTAVQVYTATE